MTQEQTAAASQSGFSVDAFAAWWAKPDLETASAALAPDIVGDWPGEPELVRGVDAYVERIAELLDLVPDLHLEVAEHAVNGEFLFIRWIAHGTGANGPFELTGIDRIRVGEDGRVRENIIRFDRSLLDELARGEARPA
jgi:hypothetical protein